MAAVRANTMQTITSKRILSDGQPFAATINAARAKGSAKIVCEKRINRRNRAIGPAPNGLIFSHGVLVPENIRCQLVITAILFRAFCQATGVALNAVFPQADRVLVKECLLARVMRLVYFRFGRFFGGFFLRLEPFSVEDTRFIDALVRVRTKEIALRLQEICWKASGAITVEIRQRGRKRGDRNAELDSCRNDEAPFRLSSFDCSREILVEEKILQRGVTPIGLNDSVEKFSADDAPPAPNRSDIAQVQVPFVSRASGSKKIHSLRVRNYFGGIKRVAHGVDETIAIAFERSSSRLRQNFRRRNAFYFSRRNHASFDSGVDCGNDDVLLDGRLKGPDAGSFLARFVKNHVHQRFAGFSIDFLKNLRCDFDQITFQLAFVPICESMCELRRIHSQDLLQNSVRFTDQLDIAVLYTV